MKVKEKKSSELTGKYLEELFRGAKSSTLKHAKELRSSETEAEKKLWSLLRNRQLQGKKFRRQHALSNYVLDFYCNECKLAIELDGDTHKQKSTLEYDNARTEFLDRSGITVLRFWNHQVIKEPKKVLEKIEEYFK